MKIHALRLQPGDDLRASLEAYARVRCQGAAFVLTTVGSLRTARLRYANSPEATALDGFFEILSLAGTLSRDGAHLHMALADERGTMWGGHVLSGCMVYTTAEIVLGEEEALVFRRELDPATGYGELAVKPS